MEELSLDGGGGCVESGGKVWRFFESKQRRALQGNNYPSLVSLFSRHASCQAFLVRLAARQKSVLFAPATVELFVPEVASRYIRHNLVGSSSASAWEHI